MTWYVVSRKDDTDDLHYDTAALLELDPGDPGQYAASFSLETNMEITLSGIPLPPSSNNMYANARRGGRMKSAKMRLWERDFAVWALENAQALARARQLLKLRLTAGSVLAINSTFFFQRSRILCKDGTPKRNDTSNYLKALHDALAEALQIDDAWFFDGMMRKRPVTGESESVTVDVEVLAAEWARPAR